MTGLIPLDGKLSKYTNVVKGWQSRYFILNPQQGILEYHISQTEAFAAHHKPRGSLMLAGAVISPNIEDELTFGVNATNGEVYKLRASNTKERQEWMSRLRAVAHHFTSQIAQEHPPLSSSVARKPRPRSVVSNISSNLNKIKDQVQQNLSATNSPATSSTKLKASQNDHMFGSTHSLGNDSQRNSAISVGRSRTDSRGSLGKKPSSSQRFLQSSDVKELQEARETLVSADHYHTGVISMLESLHHPSTVYHNDIIPADEGAIRHSLALDTDVLLLKSTSTAMMQSLNTCYSLLQKYQQRVSAAATPSDAEVDSTRSFKLSPLQPRSDAVKPGSSVATFEVPSLAEPSDEVEDLSLGHEEDLGPVDEHKNVIMHLLSQLKLGMDLTKVTLPTFILERRSLLEMFADFISHTHLLTSISDGVTEEDRMYRVVKFYLSSFHSGRRGQSAKKPYNPIVGEVFQCSFYVPKDNSEPGSAPPSADTHHRVKFISEQVSHHPPVSAFYVSCPEKNVNLSSHVWTKSKFMNMCVGVNNVGEGTLSLTSLNEDYVITYPSAFARSILTVPWSELGGRCTISCQKSGFSSYVIFHTKPTYGGQPHRVTAELKNKNGFIYCKADGKWNGEIEFTYFKQHDAESPESSVDVPGSTETMDVTKLPVCSKFVRPLDKQSRMESRKLWDRVTNALSNGDTVSATHHKTQLEDQQREIEKQRQNSQVPVPTAYFSVTKGKDFDIYQPKECLK